MFVFALTTWLALAGALDDSPAYQEGLSLYQELEFEAAIERFRAASEEPGRTDDERAVLLLWESMSRAGVGDDEGARSAARAALELDLDVQPPALAPPKVRGFLDELRPEVEAAQRAAEQAKAEPASPEDPAASAGGDELPLLLVGGGALAGVGVLGLAGAGLFAALTASSLAVANDPDAFQIDAANAVDAANAQVLTAALLGLGGVALAGAGAAVIALDLVEAE